MKRFWWQVKSGRCLVLFVVASTWGMTGLAQTADSNTIPVVTVQATQRIATENYPGVFTVFRHGNTNATLNVWYDLGGTASNGVDYALVPPHWVTIAAGATSNTVVIAPLTNPSPASAALTVTLQLTNSPLMIPVNYEIGSPNGATVYLESTNVPVVSILIPLEGMMFYTPTNIHIVASLNEVAGLTNVEFFAGTNDLGAGQLGLGSSGGFASLIWTNPPAGKYALTAVAGYEASISVTSAPVDIAVLPGPPPTNLPPVVKLVAPQNGDVFYTPTNLLLMAQAGGPDGSVAHVEFFAGTNDLGPGLPVVLDPPGVNGVTGLVYVFNWLDPAPGDYPLTAVATDNGGAATTSATVNISVVPGPPTNLPPTVRMISPADGTVFRAPMNLPLFAYADDPDGFVTSVEFFAGTNRLGFGWRLPLPTPIYSDSTNSGPLPPLPVIYPTNLFFLIWSNPPPGIYALTAEAMDNAGASTVSAPVNITILPPLPPPTNRPPVVSIVATDPVAVEGTNSWIWTGETNATPTWSAWETAIGRYFTNCGPKTASFTVRRWGDTNGDLTVPYDLGGTASNGVDYVTLPGAVTLPAGTRRALITIVPIDDGPPDVNKTVVVKLTPSTNLPPDYVVGHPSRAAAVIIDSDRLHPGTGLLPGKYFHLAAPGPNAAWFCIESSTNLIHWTPVCTNQVVNGSIDFIDPDAAGNQSRFYRVVPLTVAPSE